MHLHLPIEAEFLTRRLVFSSLNYVYSSPIRAVQGSFLHSFCMRTTTVAVSADL